MRSMPARSRIDVLTDGGGRRLIRVADDGEGMTRADLSLRSSATPHRSSPTRISLPSIRSASAARRCLRSAPWRGLRSLPATPANRHAWSIEVDGGAKSRARPRGARRGHARRGARSVLRHAGAIEVSQARPHRGGSRARSRAPSRHEPRPMSLSRSPAKNVSPVNFAAATCQAPPGGSRAWAIFSAPSSAPTPSRSQPSARALRSKALPHCRRSTRANALGQYLFVNGRPVRDKLLVGAVRAAYADYLPRDRHPLVALFVMLDAA